MKIILTILRLNIVFLACIFITSCSSLGWLKFWENDEEIEVPALLQDFKQSILIKDLWSAKLGKYDILGRITPSFSVDKIFFVNSEGTVFAFEVDTGKNIWTKETGDIVSGGIESRFQRLIYGTLDGEVVVLDQSSGLEIWRSQITSEILSSPLTDGSIVAVQGSDDSVTGFDLRTGNRKWVHQSTAPSLSLRGTATPVLAQGFIFTGFANGMVVMIYPDSGAIRLEMPVTLNEGTSELERIIDIDGKSVISNNILVSASYQGDITAIDLQEKRPVWKEKISTTKDLVEARSRVVAIDDKDLIKGFSLSTGVKMWQQDGLKLRELSSPINVRGNIAIGDYEGYLHILDSSDGSFSARKKISKNPIIEIVSEGDKLAVLDNAGRLFFLSIQ